MNRFSGTTSAHGLRRHESSPLQKQPPSAAPAKPTSVPPAQRTSALNGAVQDHDGRPVHPQRGTNAVNDDRSLADRGTVVATADHNVPAQLSSPSPSREAAVGISFNNTIGTPRRPSESVIAPSRTPDNPVSPSSSTSSETNKIQHTQTGPTRSSAKSVTGGIRSVATDGAQWEKKFHISVPASAMTDSDNHGETYDIKNAQKQRKSSATSAIEEGSDFVAGYERGSAMRTAVQEGRRPERSVSRGRTHLDKSIEATVKKPESSGHVRSRKASHMLGIFDSQNELKRAAIRGQEIEQAHSDVSSTKSRPGSPASPSSSFSQDVPPLDSVQIDYFGKRKLPTENFTGGYGYQSEEPEEIAPDVVIPSPEAAIIDTSDQKTPRPHMPANLLQEIRDTCLERPKALRAKASTPGVPITEQDSKLDISIDKSAGIHDDDEEEHISAAIYYPHEGPSVEEIESFDLPEGVPEQHVFRKDPTSLKSISTNKIEEIDENPEPREEHIDISVESEYEKSLFHGTLKTEKEVDEDDAARTPRMPAADKVSATKPPVSSSESDIESSDELADLSQTEDGITTPTARSPKNSRMRAGTVAKPKNAVTLAPYKHQVGGHSTIFRFSRRAVCKQLNNRENEFYEQIERTHPDMLKFLPRYIGVLNVTFSKGPKQEQTGTSVEEKHDQNESLQNKTGQTEMSDNHALLNGTRHESQKPDTETRIQPRIVSHSQQFGPIPQVLLNQNRHILPSEYFGLPERPKSADPTHFRQRSHDFSHSGSLLSSELSRDKDAAASPTRPPPPEHSPSWGTTSVNVPLKDKVLREVFGPPPIKHKKRHGHAHNTIPLRKDSENRRRGNMSLQVFESSDLGHRRAPQRSHSVHQSDNLSTTSASTEDLEASAMDKEYSSSTSRFDEIKNDLEKVTTTGSAETEVSEGDGRPTVRRRHSGMGLRRRRRSLSGNEKPDLEYFEDEALSAMKDAEVFAMDEDNSQLPVTNGDHHPLPQPEILSATVEQQSTSEGTRLVVAHNSDVPGAETQEVVTTDQLPVNPKDAQSSNPDQRIAYFILLEDLTAGMGRPCVLDLKMGTRQYGVEATEKKIKSQRDKCKSTTSQQLGVRICGMQTFSRKTKESKYEDKYFGRNVKVGREFREALIRFLYDGVSTASVERHIPSILHKISKLESMVRRLPGYRFYASSLLMYYDAEPEKSREFTEAQKNGVDIVKQMKEQDKKWPPPIELKLVDFANCLTAEDPLIDGAIAPPAHPQDIDRGYLRGLRSLKVAFERILHDIQHDKLFECREGEQAGRLKEKWTAELEDERRIGETEDDDGEVSI